MTKPATRDQRRNGSSRTVLGSPSPSDAPPCPKGTLSPARVAGRPVGTILGRPRLEKCMPLARKRPSIDRPQIRNVRPFARSKGPKNAQEAHLTDHPRSYAMPLTRRSVASRQIQRKEDS
jgi:hypothetical protein